MQVTELTGLEHSELRAKVGINILDNTLVSLTGTSMNMAPQWQHAGILNLAAQPMSSYSAILANLLATNQGITAPVS